jgi:hypothetical protein
MSDEWLKQLLMLPARAHIAAMNAERKARIAARMRLGDPSEREACCGPRHDRFEKGRAVGQIPELSALLEPTTGNLGFEAWFACRICGQEWIEGVVQDGKSEVLMVEKVTENTN